MVSATVMAKGSIAKAINGTICAWMDGKCKGGLDTDPNFVCRTYSIILFFFSGAKRLKSFYSRKTLIFFFWIRLDKYPLLLLPKITKKRVIME